MSPVTWASEVLGISCITNMAAGVLPQPLDHAEVMETARRVRGQFIALLEGIIARPLSSIVHRLPRGAAREHAHARFSNFKVGAALETADGTVITGCNVENATYGLTICAERVAMFKALREGPSRVHARIAVVADTAEPTPPCGACRQILWEFGGDLAGLCSPTSTEAKDRAGLKDLLPMPFDAPASWHDPELELVN